MLERVSELFNHKYRTVRKLQHMGITLLCCKSTPSNSSIGYAVHFRNEQLIAQKPWEDQVASVLDNDLHWDYLAQQLVFVYHRFWILDFYVPALNLAIEVDGAQHFSKKGLRKDKERDAILHRQGIRTVRLSNSAVSSNTSIELAEQIVSQLFRIQKKNEEIAQAKKKHSKRRKLSRPLKKPKWRLKQNPQYGPSKKPRSKRPGRYNWRPLTLDERNDLISRSVL